MNKPQPGLRAEVQYFPNGNKKKTFEGIITKVYVGGAIEVKDSNGGTMFTPPEDIVAVHTF
jgi:hypothetical protein